MITNPDEIDSIAYPECLLATPKLEDGLKDKGFIKFVIFMLIVFVATRFAVTIPTKDIVFFPLPSVLIVGVIEFTDPPFIE